VMLAAQWVTAGFSSEAAARRIHQKIHAPPTPQHPNSSTPAHRSPPHITWGSASRSPPTSR
jgi:hypothetical protein